MFATDGEPNTTWITPFDGAVGAALDIPLDGTLGGTLEILQPEGPYSRISELQIEGVDEGGESAVATVEVLPPDPGGRSRIELPTAFVGEAVRVQITGIEPARTFDRRYGDVMTLPAAIAEVVGSGIEPQSIDDSALLEIDCRGDLLEIDGDPIRVRASATIGGLLDGQPAQADVCEDTIELDAGEHRVRSTARAAGLTVDRLVLLDGSAPVDATTVEVTTTANDPRHREVEVAACPDGCWLVLGEGYNEAWEASADGRSLGPPQLVDGGFNGWWLPPSTTPVVVQFGWTAQGPVTLGLVLSSGAILACVAIILLTRRPNRRRPVAATPTRLRGAPRRPSVLSAAVFVLTAALLIAPAWGLVALAVVGARAVAPRVSWSTTNPIGWIGWGCAVITSFAVLVIERRNAPPPNAGWTESFTRLNGLALFAVLCIAIGAWDVSNARRKSGPVRSAR
jgi:arabinofuranan 3-O-arabinosyltransferase